MKPAGQIGKYCDFGFLISDVPILFHSIRVLSEEIGVVNLRMPVPCLQCVNILSRCRVRYLLSDTMYYWTLDLLDHQTNQLKPSTNL